MAVFLKGHDYEHVSNDGHEFQRVTFVSQSPRDDGVIVKFRDDAKKRNKLEYVRITHLRDIPPTNLGLQFNVGSIIDYKVNKLWKTGVVQEVTAQGYFVCDLPLKNKSISRFRSVIRPHVNWIGPDEV